MENHLTPIDYFDGVSWDKEALELNSDAALASAKLQWNWSPLARQAITKYKRLKHLVLAPEEITDRLLKNWDGQHSILTDFQRELGGVYLETELGTAALLGLSQVSSREDWGEEEPLEEFFFSRPDFPHFQLLISHDGSINQYDCGKLYSNAKVFVENFIYFDNSVARLKNSKFYYLRITDFGLDDYSYFEELVGNLPKYREITECRDKYNFLYQSPSGFCSLSTSYSSEEGDKCQLEIYSTDRQCIQSLWDKIPACGGSGWKLNFTKKVKDGVTWHECYCHIGHFVHPPEDEVVTVEFDAIVKANELVYLNSEGEEVRRGESIRKLKRVTINGEERDHTTIAQVYLNSRAIGAHTFTHRRILT